MREFSTLGVEDSGKFPTSNIEHLRRPDKSRFALPKKTKDLEVI
jgi:hypothetical protein